MINYSIDIPAGYVEMKVEEVKRRCSKAISHINGCRTKEDKKSIRMCISKHNKMWSWLPWHKPLSEDDAVSILKEKLIFFPSVYAYEDLIIVEHLLDAALATESKTMLIGSNAFILRGRFG